MRLRFILALLGAFCAWSQDSSQVLREFVGYRTAMATQPLRDEQRQIAVQLQQRAMSAAQLKQFGEALRHLHHGRAVMDGFEWTPEVQLASSLKLVPAQRILESGQDLKLEVETIFPVDSNAARSVPLALHLEGKELGRWLNVGTKWTGTVQVPKLEAGKYKLEARIGLRTTPIDIVIAPGLRSKVAALQARIAKLPNSPSLALSTAKYTPELLNRADRGEVSVAQIDWQKEVDATAELLTSLEAGADPFAGRKGDIRQAYLSAIDKTLQPFRVFVPSAYNPAKPSALVIALHGMGGDENSLFDRYGSKAIVREAERLGLLVATPKGRGPASMYKDAAETDVLDVIANVRKTYNVDPRRIYLMGHSMGGFGTWSIAMNHPTLFAALGPVSGGGDEERAAMIKHIPQYVVHGAEDKTVPVKSSRAMVEAARKAGASIEYIEVPSGGHVDVFIPAIPGMFEWLAKQRKPD